MQLSLFSLENQSREYFRKYLSEFNLNKALKELKLWQRSVDAPPDLAQKEAALLYILNNLEKQSNNRLLFLVNLYLNHENIIETVSLREDFRFLKQGLIKELARLLLDHETFDFVFEDLHPAEIFLLAGKYQRAVEVVEQYVTAYGEQAFLRQLQGAAFFKMEDDKQSRICYTLALFNDPQVCRPEYFWPRAFKNKMLFLQSKFSEPHLALLHMTLTLWEDGQLFIEPENQAFEKLIKDKIKQAENRSLNASESFLLFLHLLYVAELERLRNFRADPSATLRQLRLEMQNVNKDWYLRYENALKKFQMI